MKEAIQMRITMENPAAWREDFDALKAVREAYGFTDGPIYTDAADANTVFVHLDTENVERSFDYFHDERYMQSEQRASVTERETWLARRIS